MLSRRNILTTAAASAISATSAGKPARSAAQSRKLDRKPCTVRLSRPMRRNSIRNAVLLSGRRRSLPPGNTNSPERISAIFSTIGAP